MNNLGGTYLLYQDKVFFFFLLPAGKLTRYKYVVNTLLTYLTYSKWASGYLLLGTARVDKRTGIYDGAKVSPWILVGLAYQELSGNFHQAYPSTRLARSEPRFEKFTGRKIS